MLCWRVEEAVRVDFQCVCYRSSCFVQNRHPFRRYTNAFHHTGPQYPVTGWTRARTAVYCPIQNQRSAAFHDSSFRPIITIAICICTAITFPNIEGSLKGVSRIFKIMPILYCCYFSIRADYFTDIGRLHAVLCCQLFGVGGGFSVCFINILIQYGDVTGRRNTCNAREAIVSRSD